MKKIAYLLMVLLCLNLSANERENAYESFKAKRTQQYNEFKDNRLAAYAEFRSEIIKKWGIADTSSNKEMVKYSHDLNKKLVINFEENTVRVQSLDPLTQNEAYEFVNKELAKPLLTHVIELAQQETKTDVKLTTDKLTANSLGETADVKVVAVSELIPESTEQSVKEIEIKVSKKLASDVEQLNKIERMAKADARILPEQSPVDLQDVKTYKKLIKKEQKQTKAKPVVSYRINLSEKRLQRAEKYLENIAVEAEKYGIDPYLILAVIETESSFNPLARSSIPAFGLMQIVPITAGLDVNQKIFKTPTKPEPELLYVPKENILFGTAYLHILVNNYFSGVSDPKTKEYCSIAAYNTGIGNVAKVFTGKKAIRAATDAINRLSPEQVFEKLQQNTVPETQKYLLKVTERKEFYQKSLPNLQQVH